MEKRLILFNLFGGFVTAICIHQILLFYVNEVVAQLFAVFYIAFMLFLLIRVTVLKILGLFIK
jgi:hypothetical protein